jgi:DNA-directed RNA polymerase specialized sigma24 family protein
VVVPVGRSALDVQAAVGALPRVHALVLRGALAGFDERELAGLVGVPVESVRPLLRVAAAKLSGLLAEPGRGEVPS